MNRGHFWPFVFRAKTGFWRLAEWSLGDPSSYLSAVLLSASLLLAVCGDWVALPLFHSGTLEAKQPEIVLLLGFTLNPLENNGGPACLVL